MTSRQVERKPTVKYRLKFVPDAWREWQALDGSIKLALKPLLAKRLQNPHVPGAFLHRELAGCYKIKLLKQGYRLVYMVEDDVLVDTTCWLCWCCPLESAKITPHIWRQQKELNNRRTIMNHFLQQIEAALLPTADQYALEGSDPKAIVHQWIHAIASGNKPFAAKYTPDPR